MRCRFVRLSCFVYIPSLPVLAALARRHVCTCSSEPSLLTYGICTNFHELARFCFLIPFKTCCLVVLMLSGLANRKSRFSINSLVSWDAWFRVYFFSCSIQLSTKFQLLIKTKIQTNEEVSCFKSLGCCIYHANKCLNANNCCHFKIL